MGVFNDTIVKTEQTKITSRSVWLSCRTENVLGGLYRWVFDDKDINGFKLNGEQVKVMYNCSLLIIVDAIKDDKGESILSLKHNNIIKQKYIERSSRRNFPIKITYSGKFNKNDIIFIEFTNVRDIQLIIYGNII